MSYLPKRRKKVAEGVASRIESTRQESNDANCHNKLPSVSNVSQYQKMANQFAEKTGIAQFNPDPGKGPKLSRTNPNKLKKGSFGLHKISGSNRMTEKRITTGPKKNQKLSGYLPKINSDQINVETEEAKLKKMMLFAPTIEILRNRVQCIVDNSNFYLLNRCRSHLLSFNKRVDKFGMISSSEVNKLLENIENIRSIIQEEVIGIQNRIGPFIKENYGDVDLKRNKGLIKSHIEEEIDQLNIHSDIDEVLGNIMPVFDDLYNHQIIPVKKQIIEYCNKIEKQKLKEQNEKKENRKIYEDYIKRNSKMFSSFKKFLEYDKMIGGQMGSRFGEESSFGKITRIFGEMLVFASEWKEPVQAAQEKIRNKVVSDIFN